MSFRSPIFRKLVESALLTIAVSLLVVDLYVIASDGPHWQVVAMSLVAALAALAVALLFARSFTQRIRRLQAFAEGLVGTRLSQIPLREPDDELGALASSLNRIAAQLRDLTGGLSAEAERFEAILSSMAEGVLAVDQQLFVTFCNDSFARLVDSPIPRDKLLPVQELVPDREFIEMLRRAVISREASRQRLQLPGALGGRTFEVHAAPLSTSVRRGALAVLHDITELERLERVRKDFVANVSHELRTPLTAIRGYAETLLEGALQDSEHNRRFIEIIKANAIRLNNIASDLLTLAELDDKPLPELEAVSVRAAIETAARTVESESRVRGVSLVLGNVEGATVMGDKVRLEQALVNLIDNAVKFNRPGGEVRVESSRADDGRVRIAITDTGIGIAPEHLPRVFERFYRVDTARSREVGGTGLGLSIVKHVVERMNGSVTVESREGKGSIFTVFIPACDSKN